jgi:hypothetical protein
VRVCRETLLRGRPALPPSRLFGFTAKIRIRSRIRIRDRIRNSLKSRIRIRDRSRKKSFRIHNTAGNYQKFFSCHLEGHWRCISRIRIFQPRSWVKRIPDPESGSASKNSNIFTLKIVSQLLKIRSGMFIPDPYLWLFINPGSRGPKRHRIPDLKHHFHAQVFKLKKRPSITLAPYIFQLQV